MPGSEAPSFLPVLAATSRPFEGDLVEVRTKMGRRVRCTPDHPWVVANGVDEDTEVKLAGDLDGADWIPLAMNQAREGDEVERLPLMAAVEAAGITESQVVVRPPAERVRSLVGSSDRAARDGLRHPPLCRGAHR